MILTDDIPAFESLALSEMPVEYSKIASFAAKVFFKRQERGFVGSIRPDDIEGPDAGFVIIDDLLKNLACIGGRNILNFFVSISPSSSKYGSLPLSPKRKRANVLSCSLSCTSHSRFPRSERAAQCASARFSGPAEHIFHPISVLSCLTSLS